MDTHDQQISARLDQLMDELEPLMKELNQRLKGRLLSAGTLEAAKEVFAIWKELQREN
jgi:hypothetical protein